MSWHLSLSMQRECESLPCSLEPVAESSVVTCSDGEPSVQSKSTTMPDGSSWPGKTTDACNRSQSGTTSALSTDDRGVASWMSSLVASRAKTSASPERAQALRVPGPDSGEKWPASLAKWDPASSLWRTRQLSLEGDSEPFSETWPRWGMMQGGEFWALTTPAHLTRGTESGLWPTPWTTEAKSDTLNIANRIRKGKQIMLCHAVRLWPTPVSTDGSHGGRVTPAKAREGGNLVEAVSARTWPTPCATMSKGSSPAALTRKDGQSRMNDRLDHAVMNSDGGQLNPNWVEWLMGWPIGQTDLKPLEMGKFQRWSASHGKL